MTNFAIIGAGMAGLACARRLHEAGNAVTLFDKGRGVGGRMATRRVETQRGVVQFDHGAQYFTARDPAFRAALNAIGDAIAPWPSDLATLSNGLSSPAAAEARIVGAPGMNAAPKAISRGLDVHGSTRIDTLIRDENHWVLQADGGAQLGPFDTAVIATPAEQVEGLVVAHSPAFAAQAAAACTAPCWAGLFAYDAPTVTPFTALRFADHPVLAFIACDSDKPGRNSDMACWVAHARADWSKQNLERTPEDIAPILREALEAYFDPAPEPFVAQAHRWRYAQVERPAETPFAWDPELRLGLCGDWRIGPRVEAAWLSGHHLAGAILA